MMDWQDVETIEDCRECATLDAYGEEEQATGWLTCLEEILGDVKKVKILGAAATLKGFDLRNCEVVAICAKGEKTVKVSLDSIEWPTLSPTQELWLQAWAKWSEYLDS
jgi:hypothetical protein